jgi:hypothetical protein
MIENARATIGAVDPPKFRFEVSSAEDVHTLEDGTADLIISGMPHYSPLFAPPPLTCHIT